MSHEQHKPGCGLFIGNRPEGVPTCTCRVPAFDKTQTCQLRSMVPGKPVPTMCERCHNPHHACDQGLPDGVLGNVGGQSNG